MATSKELYDKLFDEPGKKVRIRFDSKNEYETLRTSLCRHNSQYVDLDLSTYSVCAEFNAETCVGTFWLGSAKRKQAKSWEILDD